ncbi:MAG: MFS transporter [Actinomycetota bacterium]
MSVASEPTGLRRTFLALSVRNFRLYFFGQLVSVSGTWLQSLAIGLLILKLTGHHARHAGSYFSVGVASSLPFVPMLVAGSWAGLVIDRSRKRVILYVTQSAALVLALTLGLLTVTNHVTIWSVYVIAFGLGLVNLFDNPARQTFVSEMVGPDLLPNAVSLNTVLINMARIVGPSVAVVLTQTIGLGGCFLVNAGSYVAVIWALWAMDGSALNPSKRVVAAKGQVRDGLRYAWQRPRLRGPLVAMFVVGLLAFNFTVTVLALATGTFHGGAPLVATFMVAQGIGAVLGGIHAAYHGRPSQRRLAILGMGFGVAMVAMGLMPTEFLAGIAIFVVGYGSINYVATANGTLQLHSEPQMRGRVMALYSIAFLGTAPIGMPLIGFVIDSTGPRAAILTGAVATIVSSAFLLRHDDRVTALEAASPPPETIEDR